MQVHGAARGVSTMPRRGRLEVLLAIVVIVAMVALVVWIAPLARSGVGAEDAIPQAGSAIVHDDAGNILPEADVVPTVIHDDAGSMKSH